MNKLTSRLMLASATMALAAALVPVAANATVTLPPQCQPSGGCPTDGSPWTVSSGASELISGTFHPSSLTVDGAGTPVPAVIVDSGATLIDDAIIGDANSGMMTNSGTHNVTGNLILGNQSTGNGSYTITGSSAQTNVNFAGTAHGSPPETPNGALIVGNAGIGSFTQETFAGSDTTPVVNVAGDLALGLQSGSTGTYTLNDGTLTVGGAIVIGQASTNANLFTQNGGAVSITGTAHGNSLYAPVNSGFLTESPGTLYVGGVNDSGVGTYALNNGTLNASTIMLGFSGVGTINQSGGQVTTGFIDMGNCGGCNSGNSAGFYTLNGSGTLTTGGINVGDFGHGEFTQGADFADNTVNTVNGTLAIGNGATATPNVANMNNYDRSGTYTLDSGMLNTQNVDVGNGSTGTLIQNGGIHNVSNLLDIGVQNTALSGPVGSGSASSPVFGGPALGTYTMNGGTLNVGGNNVPTSTFSNAYPGITGGTGMIVGDAGNGIFNQFGSSMVTSGTPQVPNTSAGTEGDLIIGAQGAPAPVAGSAFSGTGQGTYNLGQTGQLAAPSLTVNGSIIIGRDAGSNGATVPGASPTNANLVIQGDGTNLSVFYNGGGQANANPLSSDILVGLNGNGAVTQTGKSTVYMDGDLSIGINQGAVGSYNLSATSNGGNLQVGNFLNIGGVQDFVNCCSEQTTGFGGTGYFTQSSGDVTVVQNVDIGNNGGTGTYAMSDGTLTSGNNLFIGNSGGSSGNFIQTGGVVTVGTAGFDGTMALGTAGGVGTYSLTGASTLTVNGNVNIAQDPGSDGSSMTIGNGTDSPVMVVQSAIGNGNMVVGGGAAGSLTINSGSVTVGNVTNVGYFGTGTVNQSGGNFETGFLDIGTINTAGNTYTLSNGGVTVDQDLVVGNFAGSGGTFTQTSGTVNVNSVGFGVYINNGTYDLQSGNFNVVNNVTVGDVAGGASFTQEGGSAAIGNTLIIGNSSTASGTYTLSGGTLTTGITGGSSIGDVVIGNSGTGELDNSGGTQISESIDGFTLGWASQGTYKLTGTGSLSVAGNENIGVFGAGTFLQGDGSGNTSNTVGGSLYMSGGFGAPSSSYTLTDGTLTVAGFEVVGFAAQSSFTQSGGTNNANDGLIVGLLSNGESSTQFGKGTYTLGGSGTLNVSGDLVLGSGQVVRGSGTGSSATASSGTFNYNTASGDGGSLTFTGSGQNLVVGDAGTGIFNEGSASNTTDLNLQASGTSLDIGRSVGGTGTFNLATGSTLEDDVIVGDAGTGIFNNNGGTHTVGTSGTPASLILGNQAPGIGTYNNNGGTDTVNGNLVVGAAGTGTYNLGNATTGGDLQVQGAGLSGGNVFVGETGKGTITASSGSFATIAGGLILGGPSPGETTGTGTLTVTGFATEWINNGQTEIGGAGTGTLNVLAGGYLESHPGGSGSGTAAVLGVETGSTGTATVDGATSEWYMPDGALRVGAGSTGSGNGTQGNLLTISNGGEVIDSAGNGSDSALTDDGAAASVGWKSGSVGTVNVVTGGYWSNSGDLVIGDAGTGTVHLDNSSGSGIAVGGNLILGNLVSGNGTLNLDDGGALNLNNGIDFIVGNAGTGVVNQNGGDLNLASKNVTIDIGAQSGSTGTYNLNGGSLEDDMIVGDAGTGTFNNNGMTHNVADNLILGNQSSGNGTYNLTAGGTTGVGGFTFVGNAGTGTFLNDASTHTTQELVLGHDGGSMGTYTLQNSGVLTVGTSGTPGFFDVGEHGAGIVNQTSGTTTVYGALDIGRCGSAGGCLGAGDTDTGVGSGTVNLSGGSVSVSQFAVVGDSGTGLFAQTSNATATVGGELDIGRNGGAGTYNLGDTASLAVGSNATGGSIVLGNTGSSGAFNLSGSGSVTVNAGTDAQSGTIFDGTAGTGMFTQSGTSTVSATNVSVGNNTGGVGTYSLSGGTLTLSNELFVGGGGEGTFTQSGASSTVTTGFLSVGNNAGGVGNYNLSAGSLTVFADAFLGGDNLAQGTITQTGGTAALDGNVNVGYAAGATGIYTLGGSGIATIGGNLDIGVAANATGTVNFNTAGGDSATLAFTTPGSTMTVGDAGKGTVAQGGGDLNLTGEGVALEIGAQNGSTGTYNLTGGSLEDDLIVGDAGTGVFNNSGGTHAVTGNLILGNQASGNGTYNLSGTGALSVSGNVVVGLAGSGDYEQSSGTKATVDGTFSNSSTSTTNITGNMTNLTVGGSVMNAGTVTVGGGSTLDATGNSYTQTGSTSNTTVDGVIKATVAEIIAGTFGGTGTVSGDLSNTGGTVKPGDGAPGTLTVTGNYTQDGGGIFEAGIAGTDASQISKLVVGGTASLSGILDIDLLDGFQVANGDIFNIMSFAKSTGDFTSFELDGNGCTAGGTDIYNCSGLGDGLFFEEEFVNNDTGLDLLVEQTVVTSDVPEPWTIGLFGVGLAGLAGMRRRLKAKKSRAT